MLKIEDLKIEKKFERLTAETKEQLNALEALIVADNEAHSPIVVWEGQNIVVDGHGRVKILQKHPDIKYTIKEIAFEGWLDVIVWIVEHHIARSSFTLWQKLEMAMNCVEYWETKERARKSRGSRSDLRSPGDLKLDSNDVNTIIAEKVGCGRTTVVHFMKVFKEASEKTKQRCREGDMAIKRAYESLTPKKTTPKKKEVAVIDIETSDILDESTKNQSIGKNSSVKIPDPNPVAVQMNDAQVAEGTMWFVLRQMDGLIQVFKKGYDKEKGKIHIQVNSFNCKTLSKADGVTIFEVQHVDGTGEDISQKDETEFKSKTKKAS